MKISVAVGTKVNSRQYVLLKSVHMNTEKVSGRVNVGVFLTKT